MLCVHKRMLSHAMSLDSTEGLMGVARGCIGDMEA